MVRTQTIVQLSDELLSELDAEAAARGVSRSALIRLAIVVSLDNVSLIRPALCTDRITTLGPG